MPIGIIWLIVGTLIGLAAGWLFIGNPAIGAAAGFVITFTLLLVGTWLGGRDEDDEEISISGR